jgi:hypothetical protein
MDRDVPYAQQIHLRKDGDVLYTQKNHLRKDGDVFHSRQVDLHLATCEDYMLSFKLVMKDTSRVCVVKQSKVS